MFNIFYSAPALHQINLPLQVDVTGPGGRWRITSKWSDELSKKMVNFLTNHPFEFYGSGKAPNAETAKKIVQGARDRAEAGIPFTRFPVLNAQGKIIGEFAIGFGENPGTLEIAGRGIVQNQGIGKEILDWCFSQYLPELERRGIRVPLFDKDQEEIPWGQKRARSFVELKNSKIIATVHPDYTHCNQFLINAGFTHTKTVNKKNFIGSHDGRRNVYEIGCKKILGQKRH